MTTDPKEALERLKARAVKEELAAGNVQGPSFRGSEWGADIIAAHRQHAADLSWLIAEREGLERAKGADVDMLAAFTALVDAVAPDPGDQPLQSAFPAQWTLWKDRTRIRLELPFLLLHLFQNGPNQFLRGLPCALSNPNPQQEGS
jgi:hypothetical protein